MKSPTPTFFFPPRIPLLRSTICPRPQVTCSETKRYLVWYDCVIECSGQCVSCLMEEAAGLNESSDLATSEPLQWFGFSVRQRCGESIHCLMLLYTYCIYENHPMKLDLNVHRKLAIVS